MENLVPSYDIVQILEHLQDPAAYPHPVDNIHVVQTHISCVFLTGRHAYKIKKPVDFGFLDYSTLERRHHYCQQELALNRRLCPDIYLEVVPITAREGGLQIGGEGTPVEWAVQMRQMREADMLSTRLEAGAVLPADIARIARLLAEFHERAASGPEIRHFGDLAVIAQTIGKTLDTMDAVAAGHMPGETLQAIRRHLEGFQHREAALFRWRQTDNRTRDCHGDLRLQNICLDPRFDMGIEIFDCIEFNEAFRYIDVAADLAYLAMDLDLAGRADLREVLVDAYRRSAGDAGLRTILRFYQAYRAVVRGNIALLAAAEPEIDAAEHAAQRQIAATAYDLARCYTHHRGSPALLIMVGLSGAGKSVLAQELSRRLPAVYLSSDQVRKERAGVSATTTLDTEHYSAANRAAVYAELRRQAGGHLSHGQHVLLDATFLSAQERAAAAEIARREGAEFWILECRCPDAVIRRRLSRRHHDVHASDAGLAVYEAQRRAFEPILPPDPDTGWITEHVVVDTDRPVNAAAHLVVDRFLSRQETEHNSNRSRQSRLFALAGPYRLERR